MSFGLGFGIREAASVLVVVWIVAIAGHLFTRISGLEFGVQSQFATEFLLGYAFVSIGLLLGTLLFRKDTGTILAGIAIVEVIGLTLCISYCGVSKAEKADSSGLAFLITGVCCIWSQAAMSSVQILEQTGKFPAWRDFFIHAGTIVQFSHFESLNGDSIFLTGVKMPFYHFASYMLPAALHDLSGVPAISIATTFFVLLGYVCMCLGSFVLGDNLAGRSGGVAAVAAIVLVPDASHYGLKCAWFGFHWMQQVTPTSPFAVGIALLAIASLVRSIRTGSIRMAGIAIVSALSCVLIRAHIFVVIGVMSICLFLIFTWSRTALVRYGSIGMVVLALPIIAFFAESVVTAPHFFTGVYAANENLKFLLSESAVSGLPDRLLWMPSGLRVLVLSFVAIVGLGGAYTLTYFASLFALVRMSKAEKYDLIPLLVLLSYLTVVIAFPVTNTPDPRELQQRSFVIVYAVLAIWSAAMMVRLVSLAPVHRTMAKGLAAAVCVVLLLVPYRYGPKVQYGKLSWAPQFIPFDIPIGLVAVAKSIRDNTPRDSVVWETDIDNWAVVVGLSERSGFTSLTDVTGGAIFLPGASVDLFRQREAIRPLFTAAKTNKEIIARAASEHISHYIVAPDRKIVAEPSSSLPVDGGYSLLAVPKTVVQ